MDRMDLFVIVILLYGTFFIQSRRLDRSVKLPADKFWSLVRSQENSVVLLATRGWIIKRLCYILPHQGILFVTDARRTEAPAGVTLIGAGDSLSLS